MKTLYTFLLAFLVQAAAGQYCGSSGSWACAVNYFPFDSAIIADGSLNSFPCIIRGEPYYHAVTFRTGAFKVSFSGQEAVWDFDSLLIYSITGLPQGLCWSTSIVNNLAVKPDYICLALAGITFDTAGLYYYDANLLIYPPPPWPMYPEIPLHPIRIINSGDTCATGTLSDIVNSEIEWPGMYVSGSDIVFKNARQSMLLNIFDVNGRQIVNVMIDKETQSIPFGFPAGFYLAILRGKNGTETVKLVKP